MNTLTAGVAPVPADASAGTTPAFRRLVVAAGLGSAIEHYDFFIYAFTAPLVFDHFFFPRMDSVAGHVGRLRHLRDRIRGAAARRHRVRPLR